MSEACGEGKEATGMLLVDSVLCEQKKLRPGDILLSLEGEVCIDFVHLEKILDSKVGSSVEIKVCRGGNRVGTESSQSSQSETDLVQTGATCHVQTK